MRAGETQISTDFHQEKSPAALEETSCNCHREEELGKGIFVPSTAGKYSELSLGVKKALSSRCHLLSLRFVPQDLPVPNYTLLFNDRRAHGTPNIFNNIYSLAIISSLTRPEEGKKIVLHLRMFM